MNPRTTVVLALVAAALGAFVYFYQVRGGERREAAAERAKRLFPELEAADVRVIEFTTSDKRGVRLEFGGAGWALVQPLAFPADESAASGMASNLAQLASEGAVEEAQAPEVYGLGEGALEVRFRAGEAEHRVRFGKKTPVDYDTYVTADGGDTVYTVPSHLAGAFERSLDDLRERRVLRFDRNAVDRIEAGWPGGGVVLEKRDDTWRLVEPLEGPADARTVDDLLADLSFLRADGFLDEPDPALETGFDAPAFRVVLRARPDEEGEEPGVHTLVVGRAVDGAQRLVRGMATSLYKIASERLDDFPRRTGAYRFRSLAEFAASDARRLELAFHPKQGEPLAITAERGDAGWTSTPEAVASGKAARLVAELARLRAEDVEAESMGPDELAAVGLAPPRARLRAWGDPPAEGGEPRLLADVALGEYDSARGIPARRADSEIVYRLDYGLAEHIPVSLDAFRNRFVSQETPEGEAGAGAEAEDAGEPDPFGELPDLE